MKICKNQLACCHGIKTRSPVMKEKLQQKEREKQERKKVMKAIQDFLAAGYSLYVSGEVECEGTYCHAVLGEVGSVEIENDEVVLNFIEQL